jgi:hypothetical protein
MRPAASSGIGGKKSASSAGNASSTITGAAMPVQFRKDIDPALADARTQHKPVLLDFSAAPM